MASPRVPGPSFRVTVTSYLSVPEFQVAATGFSLSPLTITITVSIALPVPSGERVKRRSLRLVMLSSSSTPMSYAASRSISTLVGSVLSIRTSSEGDRTGSLSVAVTSTATA